MWTEQCVAGHPDRAAKLRDRIRLLQVFLKSELPWLFELEHSHPALCLRHALSTPGQPAYASPCLHPHILGGPGTTELSEVTALVRELRDELAATPKVCHRFVWFSRSGADLLLLQDATAMSKSSAHLDRLEACVKSFAAHQARGALSERAFHTMVAELKDGEVCLLLLAHITCMPANTQLTAGRPHRGLFNEIQACEVSREPI
jgi:hypothetical protein